MKSTLLVLFVMVGLLVASCTPAAPAAAPGATAAPAADDHVLRVGVLGPFTNTPAARIGAEIRNGVIMAFEEVNYKIGDYEVELYWIDSQSNPEKAVRAYEEAVTRFGIDAGLGGWHSSVGVALMDVLPKYQIPHFFNLATTELIAEKYRSDPEKYKYHVGKFWAGPQVAAGKFYVEALEDQIARGVFKPEGKVALICAEDGDWGRSFVKAIKHDLEAAGWKIASEDYVPMGETDFYPLLTKWKDIKADLLVMTDTPPTLAAWVKQTKEIGLTGVRLADAMPYISEWYSMMGDASDYTIAMESVFVTPEQKAFAEAYEKQWGFRPGLQSGGFAYDYGRAFIKVAQRALEKYGKIDKTTLMKIADEEIVTGQLAFDGVVVKQYKYSKETMPEPIVGEDYFFVPVLQYFGGKGTIIWPESLREADLKFVP